MIIVISPAKSLDFDSTVRTRRFTQPEFLNDSAKLIQGLKKLNPEQVSELMNISSNLGELNYQRYANWSPPFDKANARQAIFAFKGDVYLGLQAELLSAADLTFAQKHLRILSGLYGVLKPLDLMQAYRLEMGTRLKNGRTSNLYEFWGSKLTTHLNDTLAAQNSKILINLASNEYFSSIKTKELDAEIVTPVFKDFSNGQYKVVSFFAKKARGMMSSFIIKNRIKSAAVLNKFDEAGYQYSARDSSPSKPVFLRKDTAAANLC